MLIQYYRKFAAWLGDQCSIVYLISMAIIAYEVFARYFFNAPSIWVHETVIALTAIGFLIGGLYALEKRDHIAITFVYSILPAPVRRVLDVFSILAALAYLSGLGYAAFVIAEKSWRIGETSASAWNPPTPVLIKSVLAIAVTLMLVHLIGQLVSALSGYGRDEANED